MFFALLLGGVFYFIEVASMSAGLGALARPGLGLIIVFTIALVILAVVGHIVIAIFTLREAGGAADERERRIFDRAGHLSGYVFGFGVVPSLGIYLFTQDGNLLFYSVFASLMISQLAEYVVQIFLYRTVV